MSELIFIVPGAIEQVTGGHLFDRRVVDGLREAGGAVAVADGDDAAVLARLPDGALAVIDGLALPVLADSMLAEAGRLRLVAFVHHPLADEGGIPPEEARRRAAIETRVLPRVRGVLCPSHRTAAALARYGVAADRIAVTPPGIDKPESPPVRAGPVRRLLCVANVIPRKGHAVLIEALSYLADRDWRLDCVGSLARDPMTVASLRAQIAAFGLGERVTLLGEHPPETIAARYRAADAFVLPSHHEGYGMAFAEAMAFGLPIVATRAGAIPETVPQTAGLLVPPGDAAALAQALRRLIDEPGLAPRLSTGALAAAARLPDWPAAVAAWRRALDDLSRRPPPRG